MEQLNESWRKSSYSGANGGSANCVELGQGRSTVLVRDTVDRAGFVMSVASGAWHKFTGRLKANGA